MKTSTYPVAYRIAIRRTPGSVCTAYVAKNDGRGTWDGAWFTHNELNQIKYWKTRAGAERWIAARPMIVRFNDPVVEEVSCA